MNVRMPLDEERVKYWIPAKMSETFILQNGEFFWFGNLDDVITL